MNADLHPPGSARLSIVIPVTIASFYYAASLDYTLPLFFGALHDASPGQAYPYDMWSQLIKFQVTPWLFAPLLAGILARRFGERRVWSMALFGSAIVPAVLVATAAPWVVKVLAFWQGLAGAMMWIAGLSLVQMVAPSRKGLSNGLMMASIGVGSIVGPLSGRAMLYHREFGQLVGSGDYGVLFSRLFRFTPTHTTPALADFYAIFWLITITTALSGVLVGAVGQLPGEFAGQAKATWIQIKRDVRSLAGNPRFWALVLILCGIGGPIFQSSNQFLPYRADDLGLKSGGVDQGWLWLQLLKTFMWLPGGLAVGWIAGKRAAGVAAAAILGVFSLAGLAIGWSHTAVALFASVAAFEFVRQFMRWLHGGYLSEHMPEHLRATAIGFSITISGLSSTVYAWMAMLFWNPGSPGFNSARPFLAVGIAGLVGVAALLVFDRFYPIRQKDRL